MILLLRRWRWRWRWWRRNVSSPLEPYNLALSKTTTLLSSSHGLLPCLAWLSTATAGDPHHFMVEYLITSLGFSPDNATKASNPLTHLKSTTKPDSVLHFLKQSGWSATQIRALVAKRPLLLCSSVETTIVPKIRVLKELGFSHPDIIQLVSDNPLCLGVTDLRPKIDFLRKLLGTNEKLLKANKFDSSLLSSSFKKKLMPNISFLRESGIPDRQIAMLMLRTKGFVTRRTQSIAALLDRAEGLGIPRGCGMFYIALSALSMISSNKLDAKLGLLRSLGWSEAETAIALQRLPTLLGYSEKKIRRAMDFLVNEVGCTLSYIAHRPVLLGFSLQRRLIPRYYVLRNLELEGLLNGRYDLLGAFKLNEKMFLQKFVLPHEEMVPGLHEAYVLASAGKVSL